MPGGKGFVDSPTWFEERFGFKERSYKDTHRQFEFADGILTSKVNGANFHVGAFETPSLEELRDRLGVARADDLGSLSFENVTGAAKTLHLDPINAGAVFQVASQFNCLEMNEPGARPEDGVTRYYCDATQGPACALACPAATVYRNYFVNDGRGQAGKVQIDCLAGVADLLENAKERHWKMVNGYCMPDSSGGIARASARIKADPALAERVQAALRVGVHWDTEVKGGSHRVCQVFSSALPVAYAKSVRSNDWAPFACAVLDATYVATLTVATLLAAQRQERVKVFLTAVGGGAFGNRSMWIVNAMEKALASFKEAPLDVKLVHFGSVPRGTYKSLEEGRKPKAATAKVSKVAAGPAAAGSSPLPASACAEDAGDVAPAADGSPPGEAGGTPATLTRSGSGVERLAALFAKFDENGDGVMDKAEMCRMLRSLDESFTEEAMCRLFENADADGDGEVHYAEFIAWVCGADSSVALHACRFAGM